jgi:type IV pilus assembly protein PilQ
LKSAFLSPHSVAALRTVLVAALWTGAWFTTGCTTDRTEEPATVGEIAQDWADTPRPPSVTDENFMPYWQEQAKSTQPRRAAEVRPPPVPAAALAVETESSASAAVPLPEPELPVKRVSLVMRDTEVRDILLALARSADINLLISPEITGTTSVELRDVPWDEAFTGLLANLGLHHKWMGSVLRVMTAEALQKELEIEKLEKERYMLRHERRQVEELLLQTIPVHYADATKLQPILEDLLTALDEREGLPDTRGRNRRRGSVAVDETNNALVINALRDDILKMIEVVTVLDQPKDQVLIEATIVVANRQTARELGFQWGGVYRGGGSYIYPGAYSNSVLGNGAGTAIDPTSGNFSNFPSSTFTDTTGSTGNTGTTDGTGTTANSTVVGATGLSLGYAYQNLGHYILSAQLTALESAGKAQIIATPSITALDNEQATLKSGFEIPYQSYSETEGNEVEFKEALLELSITPHVIDGHMVKLRVVVSNDEPDYSRVDTGVTEEPAISRRMAETSLLLFDGETTVIGGLSRTYGNDSVNGVPVLKDIPWIGHLFRSKAREKREEDMLIFITPHILGEKVPPAPETQEP